MPSFTLGKIDILNVDIANNQLHAEISHDQHGVYIVQISSLEGVLLQKRFVQFEVGENNLQFPIGDLQKGQYVLSLLKGNQLAKHLFSH